MSYYNFLGCLLTKFEFSSTLWFLKQDLCIEDDIATIFGIHQQMEAIFRDGNVDITNQGCYDFLEVSYLREVWVTESATQLSIGETEEVAMKIVEGSPKPDGVSDRNWKKVVNLKRALHHVRDINTISVDPDADVCRTEALGDAARNVVDASNPAVVPITMNIIQALHRIVGHELIDSAGEFRSSGASAAHTTVCYLEPGLIGKRLPQLVRFVNEELRKAFLLDGHGRLKVTLRIAALFFSEFLKIRPFSNGNGRVARLIVNHVLYRVCIVPISIFLDISREQYLSLLMESQWQNNLAGLTTMFLLSAKRTAFKAEYLLLNDDGGEHLTTT